MSVITVDLLEDVRPSVSGITIAGDLRLPHHSGTLSVFLSHTSSGEDVDQQDDELIRAYVSRLWAEDWDSPEDSVYDDG